MFPDTAASDAAAPPSDHGAATVRRHGGLRLGVDWAAVIAAAVLVVLAAAGLLPRITFPVK